MKNLLISFAFALFSPFLMAEESLDSLKKPDLTYHSELEKNNFQAYILDKQFDTIAFLLSIDSAMTQKDARQVVNDLSAFYKTIDTEGDKKKKNLKKFVDFLFTNIHAQFLKKYEENIVFNRIFQDGVYNCITASALYALVFEHYGIRYHIKELPTHIYIVVDPEGLSIQIETTDPKGGYFAPTDKFKKNYVNELIESKVVTQAEVNTEGGQAIFEKHYYDNKNAHISMKQLVALLYFNNAVTLSEMDKNEAAFFELEKAYYLYPCERIKLMLFYAFSVEFNGKKKKLEDIENVKFYTKVFPFLEKNANYNKVLIAKFEDITDELLIKNNKIEYFDQVYAVFKSAISDTSVLSEIDFTYYSSKAQEAFLKSKFKSAVDYTVKSLDIHPDDLKMRSNLSSCILRGLGFRRDFEKMTEEMDSFALKYPFLLENDYYFRGIVYSLMSAASTNCFNDAYDISLKSFERFEKMMAERPMTFEDDIVGSAYGEASSYCIRKLIDYEKARDWLNKGLKYEPNSPTVKRKMKTLEENPEPSKSKVSTEEIKVIELSNPNFKVLSKPAQPKKKN